MDLVLALKKYFQNFRLILIISGLFIFSLFLVNNLFSISGGTLNVSYNLAEIGLVNVIITIFAIIVYFIAYSIFQSIIIYNVENTYSTKHAYFGEIKLPFLRLAKFNIIFFVIIYALYSLFYTISFSNNIIVNLLFLIPVLFLWFVPQVLILEREETYYSIYRALNYIVQDWKEVAYLFVLSFILVFFGIILDSLIPGVIGTIISVLFVVIFVIPYIEILKSEIYLNKYKLLKPFG